MISSTKEPLLHTHIMDGLPEDHVNAYQNVCCERCGELVHAFNNELMDTWVETEKDGNFCLSCFVVFDDEEI